MGAHCNDHTLSAVRTVYAKAIFGTGVTTLPLEALFDHEDCIEILSPDDLAMQNSTLLCVAIAKRPDALEDMEALITGHRTEGKALASAQVQDGQIAVLVNGKTRFVPNEDTAVLMQQTMKSMPLATRFAVLGAWCTGYRVVLYGSEELL